MIRSKCFVDTISLFIQIRLFLIDLVLQFTRAVGVTVGEARRLTTAVVKRGSC